MGPWAFRARARGRAAGGGPRRRGRGPRGQGADLADRRPPAREKPPPTDRWPGTPVCGVGPHAGHSAPQSPVVAQAAAGVVPERPQRDAGFPGPKDCLLQHRSIAVASTRHMAVLTRVTNRIRHTGGRFDRVTAAGEGRSAVRGADAARAPDGCAMAPGALGKGR